jgi:hypothetical protein
LALHGREEMECPKCKYVMGPFDTECPRCAQMQKQACEVCGRQGIAAKCSECGKIVCSACAVPQDDGHLCKVCAPADQAAAHTGEAAESPEERPLPGPGFVREASRPGYDGIWGEVRRGLVFMRECLGMAFRDKDLLIPPLLSIVIGGGFVVVALLLLKATGLDQQFFSDEDGYNTTQLVVGFLIAFIGYSISYFFTGMTVHLINVHLKGQDAKLGPAFQDALKNIFAITLLAGVSAIISLLTSRRRRGGGIGADDIAAGMISRVWTVMVYLFLPIIILEDVSLGGAAARAKDIHARNLVPIAIGEIGVILVNRIIGFAAILLAVVPAIYIGVVLSPALLIPVIIVVVLWLAFVMAYTSFIRTAYYTCLYLWAVERAAVADMAAVPKPLAAAMAA